jgi:hypothetical protein
VESTAESKGPLLLAGGFPTNFPGTLDPITLCKIRRTRALLSLGVLQALLKTTAGLIPFGGKEKEWISRAYRQLRGR